MNVQFLKPLKEIDQNRFDQDNGTYSNSDPCCFGAHLAHVLLFEGADFKAGRSEFKKRLGNINDAQLFLLFQKAGLEVSNPFSDEEWNISVKQVIENLEKMEEIPDLKNADFEEADFEDANFEGVDFTGANLTNVNLLGANLRGANFTGANLENANLENANLENANFTDANLTNAELTHADLRNANLTNADLENAYLRDANFTDANLENADFTKANLTDAKDFILSNKQKKEIK